MNKKKLTLLIALSTTIAIIFGYFLSPIVAALPSSTNEAIVVETIVEEDPEPLPQIAVEEEVKPEVEEVVEEEISPVIEEPAAAEPVVEIPPVIVEQIPQGEYAVAEQVWSIMKSYGWSDEICAGIIGNMMRECGGDTLQLNPYTQNSHYGLCQWSRTYHYGAWGKDVAGQLEYLKSSLNIAIFDGCTTPEEVAGVFCDKYERPGSRDPRYKRLANARAAYEYFVG